MAPEPKPLTLSEDHLQLLRWIADGCPARDWPDHTHKIRAYALANRGLALVYRYQGKWRADITEAGSYFLEHGALPPPATATASTRGRSPASRRIAMTQARSSAQPAPTRSNTGSSRAANESLALLADQIRKPHPVVRDMIKHQRRLRMSAENRRRALLIAHSIVREALGRGWTVKAVEYREKIGDLVWQSQDSFAIDAGDEAVGLRFRVRHLRQPHVDTPKEATDRARGRTWGIPRWDYVPSDRLQISVRAGHETRYWEDTERKRVEVHLAAVLRWIDRASEKRRELEARLVQWEEDRRKAEQERRVLQERVERYDRWQAALVSLQQRVQDHDNLAAFVAGMEQRNSGPDRVRNEDLADLLSWAKMHLRTSDPVTYFSLPAGEAPDMTHEAWQRAKASLSGSRR